MPTGENRSGRGVIVVLIVVLAAMGAALASTVAETPIEFFTRSGCPHCAEARAYLDDLQRRHPNVRVIEHDVHREPDAPARLSALAKQHGVLTPSVPAILVKGALIVGFDSAATTGAQIDARVTAESDAGSFTEEESCPPVAADSCVPPPGEAVSFLGVTFSPERHGLWLFTVVVGLIDGFNPCSLWVLIFMLAILAPMRDRTRMLAVAGTFVAVEGIAYFAFMTAWLNAFVLIGVSRWSELGLAAIAWVAGAIHVKDFFAFGRGISLSIPASAKTRIYARIRDIATRKSLASAVAATIVLAVLVQGVEFMCTAGLPALYTRILTLQPLAWWNYYGHLLLYILMYMLDDALVLGVGVVTLSRRRLQEREGRWLKLLSGTVMIALGFYLVARG